MNATSVTNNEGDFTPPAQLPDAWIGFDWGYSKHAYALRDRSGKQTQGTLEASPEQLHSWLAQLQPKYNNLALAIEGTPASVMAVLAQYPSITVYPINPASSERFRKAFVPSGAKDDLPDAQVLLDMVYTHADKFRAWEAPDQLTHKLNKLVQARREMVDRRTRTLQRLTSLLRDYYPQALELVHSLSGPLALEFLERWPDLISLKAARPGTIKTFYYKHNVRSAQLVEQRLKRIKEARALTTDEAIVSVAVLQVQELIAELAVFHKHIPKLDKAIEQTFQQHPDAHLFRDLPGAGKQMAPRLCAAFGTDRQCFPDAASFQKHAGVVPVIEKSGQQCWVHWRWNAPAFLRQSLVEWAGLSILWSAWAKRYYDKAKASKKKHSVILRALAAKWVRILWKCWTTQTPYNEELYLKALAEKNSPYAA